jgi:hypothetical protein
MSQVKGTAMSDLHQRIPPNSDAVRQAVLALATLLEAYPDDTPSALLAIADILSHQSAMLKLVDLVGQPIAQGIFDALDELRQRRALAIEQKG